MQFKNNDEFSQTKKKFFDEKNTTMRRSIKTIENMTIKFTNFDSMLSCYEKINNYKVVRNSNNKRRDSNYRCLSFCKESFWSQLLFRRTKLEAKFDRIVCQVDYDRDTKLFYTKIEINHDDAFKNRCDTHIFQKTRYHENRFANATHVFASWKSSTNYKITRKKTMTWQHKSQMRVMKRYKSEFLLLVKH